MNAKTKRPALISDYMVKPEGLGAAPPVATALAPPGMLEAASVEVPSPSAGKAEPPAAEMFRTSVYFARSVHDKLREIAFTERKSITDLINEGLDHVLTSRNYATTGELKGKRKR